jgi:hypothetical protein
MPPKKVAKVFSKSVMGLSAAPIVRFMRKLIESARGAKQPFYALAHELLVRKANELFPSDVPERIAKVVREIKELFIHGILVAEVLSGSQQLLPNDIQDIQTYATAWGINGDFLKP